MPFAAMALWVTILVYAGGYVRKCPTGKNKEEGENSLLEAAKNLAFASALAKVLWVPNSQQHCRMRVCQA